MSDISFQFPLWVSFAIFGSQYWYVFAPAGLALGGIAGFARVLPIALRYAAGIGAATCAAPFALLLVLIVADKFAPMLRAAHDRALHRTLTAGETVSALSLPAGVTLEFTDETQRVLSAVALPRPMTIVGISLEGRIEPFMEGQWSGDLAGDQTINDWPCRAGVVWFTPQGAVTRCTLAAAHRLAGYDLPPGAEGYHDPATGRWELQLPQTGPALRIAALNADLPPGGSLVLAADNALRRLHVPHEARMTIAGVALYDHIVLEGPRLTAELAEPREVDGVTLPADTAVRLDLSSGKVAPTTRAFPPP
jgi:hypothetical protein